MQPLQGITVVSLEQAVAAPFASRQLAELGARVIKIERADGGDFARHYDQTVEGLSSHFVWVNRSKESLAIDLKEEAGKEVLHRLLSRADVFLQNLAPGAVERLGFGSELLRGKYPGLIVCNVSGYGPDGPYRDRKAYDLLVQAESGFLSVTGTPDEVVKAGVSVADIGAGMYAFSGILAALIERGRTGEGTVIEISLFDALCEWMGFPAYFALGGQAPERSGAAHSTIVPYGPFSAGDGNVVLFSIQNEREWVRFCTEVLDRPDLVADPRSESNSARLENRTFVEQTIRERFATFDIDELVERLDGAAIANGRVRDVSEFWSHPQLVARQRVGSVGSAAGSIPALSSPLAADGHDPHLRPIPACGEQTEAILKELGYSPEKIDWLAEQRVIQSAPT